MPQADYGEPNYWLTCITIDPDEFGATREDVRLALERGEYRSAARLEAASSSAGVCRLRHIWRTCFGGNFRQRPLPSEWIEHDPDGS